MPMRAIFLLLLLPSLVVAASPPDALNITQRYVDAGATELALARIEQLQPAAPSAPGWNDWEQLRCTLLAQLDHHQALVERAAQLPAGAPQPLTRTCLLGGARAAIALKEGAQAREFLVQVIWNQSSATDDWRAARLLVIDSYLADGKPDDAYLLMLRYQQDYPPLDRATATHFAAALLAAGNAQDAVNWLPQLDDAGPVKAWLRMNTHLITPEAAVTQARAALAKKPDVMWWKVIQQAALVENDRVLQTEALENLLELADDKDTAATLTATLHQDYETTAQDVANRAQLLIGDDDTWMNYANGGTPAPAAARALYAYLTKYGKMPATRDAAQARQVLSFIDGKLMLAAARVLDGVQWSSAQTDVQAQLLLDDPALSAQRREILFTLGVLAESAHDYQRAADYYLEAALTDAAKTPDAFTLDARLHAAGALAHAGLQDDAHAQFEWLRKNDKDRQRLEATEHELQLF